MNCELIVNTFSCLDQVTWWGFFLFLYLFGMASMLSWVCYKIYKEQNK